MAAVKCRRVNGRRRWVLFIGIQLRGRRRHFLVLFLFLFLTNYVIYKCMLLKKFPRRAFFSGYLCWGPYSTRGGGYLWRWQDDNSLRRGHRHCDICLDGSPSISPFQPFFIIAKDDSRQPLLFHHFNIFLIITKGDSRQPLPFQFLRFYDNLKWL